MEEAVSSANQFDIVNNKQDGTYYNLQKLNQKHLEIIRLIALGAKDHEIAERLNCTTAMVKYTRESPIAQRKIEILQGRRDNSAVDIRKRLDAMAPVALDKMQEILDDEKASDGIKTKIATDVLDRAGFSSVNKTLNLDKYAEEEIKRIKERARQNGLVAEDEVEEADYVEEKEEK